MPHINDAKRLTVKLRCYEVPYGYIVPVRGMGDSGGCGMLRKPWDTEEEMPMPVAARVGDALIVCNPFEGELPAPPVEEVCPVKPEDIELFFNSPEGDRYAYKAVQIGEVLYELDDNEFMRAAFF
ncbi:MAG: hypothetical protein ABIN58_04190 [candidate division WOR-3 bacterium]